MALRNAIFEQLGTLYPDNIYDITLRTILDHKPSDPVVNVDIIMNVYTDESMDELAKQHSFILYNIPNNQASLNPAAYQAALLLQQGNVVVDGTALSDFEVL